MNAADISRWLANLEAIEFYGSVEVKFEAGHVVLARKTETLKQINGSFGINPGGKYGKECSKEKD